ncbi:pheromone receptor [Colletotrichum orchidophilum]|uniref:Pheromone receptor n=1 Tax=Colletotrichum orchidophilum TaxID=1209926 RepID=A0A1G4BFN9_9PEZI|nr:pheromone receptor [Colletotrichum orchidophilum]OHF00127.1 pheromone receptor [Colletotrichum orchidophilum]
MSPIPNILSTRSTLAIPYPPTAPYTTPSLTANLICRVVLGILSNIGCLVPLKNLYRHGEFAPAVFVGTVILMNFSTAINALVWRNDNVYEWLQGQIWCDIHAYVYQPLIPLYSTSCLAITRNLAQQMGLSRATPLSTQEKRRKMLRYSIATLSGCIWSGHGDWVVFVFFLLPNPILALAAGFYAVLTWKRYTRIELLTRSTLMSNSSAAARASRTRWRIFSVMICVLVLYIPLYCYQIIIQLRTTFMFQTFDFDNIRKKNDPLPWDTVLLYPHSGLSFFQLNHQYLVIASAVPIFFFSGMTEDIMRTYRSILLKLGCGGIFRGLRKDAGASGVRPKGLQGESVVQRV